MTKVICELTGCKFNSSCCTSPADGKECYYSEICQLDCSMFEEGTEKEVECRHCQIEKYGGIRLPREISFENCECQDFKY